MVHQVALTICAPVEPGRLAGLQALLAKMGSDSGHNHVVPFADVSGTHFARILVFGDDEGAPTLALMLDVDAPAHQRVRELVEVAGTGLDELFDHCRDYPQPARRTAAARRRYLRGHLVKSSIFYVHESGRTVARIQQEAVLRREVETFLDREAHRWEGCRSVDVWAAVREFVRGHGALEWALTPPARPGLLFRIREVLHGVGVPVALLAAAPVLLPAAAAWVAALRVHEMRDPAPRTLLDPERQRELGEAEDFGVHNAFASLAPLKPGLFWRITSALTMAFGNYTARHVYATGGLAGLSTVHFGRFARVGPGSRILFTSYYDGSLESYNNDFIDQIGWVLNTVFGQQDGYPRTRWMIRDGASDEAGFKAFIRGHQIRTPVWYSAYPELPAVLIDQNSRLRLGLTQEPVDEAAAEELLRVL